MAKVYIGTSGFSYPHWGNGVFYPAELPQKDWFLYYTKHFDTVELNVSFYRLPRKEVFAGWRKKAESVCLPTGRKFVFALKGSRFITHVKKLKNCQEPVKTFFENASGVKNKNDVVLWQLPPGWGVDYPRLESFLKILPKTFRHAFEFRNQSWLSKEIYKILRKYEAAIVFQDFPDWPMTEEITADFVYLRFHGRTSLYSSCYTEKELVEWAAKIRGWIKKDLDVYAYFNNDALGYAVENAKRLKELCLKRR